MQILQKYIKVLCILWTIIMIIGLSIPVSSSGESKIFGIDKLIHFLIYFIWSILLLYSNLLPRKNKLVAFILVGITFAAGTEIWQGLFIQGRTGDIYDFVANFLGVIFGIFSVYTLKLLSKKHTQVNEK